MRELPTASYLLAPTAAVELGGGREQKEMSRIEKNGRGRVKYLPFDRALQCTSKDCPLLVGKASLTLSPFALPDCLTM